MNLCIFRLGSFQLRAFGQPEDPIVGVEQGLEHGPVLLSNSREERRGKVIQYENCAIKFEGFERVIIYRYFPATSLQAINNLRPSFRNG